jgi:hypothetical protein
MKQIQATTACHYIEDVNSNLSPITYLLNAFKKPFLQIKFNYASRQEIEKNH